jgi:hypothetical protein
MPLGLGIGLGSDTPVSSGYGSGVLFERDGDWVAGDLTLAVTSNCNVSVGTTNVGGISNYIIMEMTDTDGHPDPQFAYGSAALSLFNPSPQDIYDAQPTSGSFKLTCKVYIPSSNTATGAQARARVNGTAGLDVFANDTWTTISREKDLSALSLAPNADSDFFEVEFDDGDANEPALGDVMYVTQFKVEYIAD